jgi:hypothetical protein
MRTIRSLLAVATLAWCALTASGATKTLLLLEDQEAVAKCGKIYRDWKRAITEEGWRILTVPIPRWDRNWSSNHWPSLNRMSNAVAWAQPDAVQIFGSLPYGQFAVHAADGHEYRRACTDAWLGCTNLVLTDSTMFFTEGTVQGLPSVIGTNAPGDGFPDQIGGTFSVPVSRLDAAGMTAFGGAGSTFASGYLAGTQTLQAIDEGYGLRAYLTSNVAYRRKEWTFAELGYIENAGWDNHATITATNTAVTWSRVAANAFAGLTNRWSYVHTELNYASPNFITAGGVAKLDYAHVWYKSYHMEVASGACFLNRMLFPGWWPRPLAFGAAWGYGVLGQNPYWAGRASDETFGDFIRSSVLQASGTNPPTVLFNRHWVVGDVTLPCDPITRNPVGATSGTKLRVIAP